MSENNYLDSMVAKYAINEVGVKARVQAIYPTIQSWAGSYLNEAIYSGSIAKETAVSLSTDADVFISLSSTTPYTLSQIYNSLYDTLVQNGFQARKQNVSIGVSSGGFKIDLVPGKRQSPQGYDHSLFRSKTGTWTKTNVKTHVNHVSNSNRQREIKVVKIWRQLNQLEFPSFYLELAVINCLSGWSSANFASNCWEVFGFLESSFVNRRYVDPANSNNVVSDDLNNAEKQIVKRLAAVARSKKYWSDILW